MSATSGDDFTEQHWREFCRDLSTKAKFGAEMGLDTMHEALSAEGHPERSAPAILVAGTNGKGGTAAYISGILQAHGLRVGLYTSPHLIDLSERFRVDGQPLDVDTILPHGRSILRRYGHGGEPPNLTYFELTTLMAARLFETETVDVAVYEVGLGGRLDAVNAIDPAVSVITCIDTDHTDYLGEGLSEIAREKCGIARANTPLVVGRQTHREVLEVVPDCAPDAIRELYGRDYDDSGIEELVADGVTEQPTWPWTKRANAAAALRAVRQFLDDELRDSSAADGLRRTRWPGRFDWRTIDARQFDTDREIRTLFDAAHNPGAVDVLFDQLGGDWPDEFAGVVCGGMTDKKLETMFARLADGPSVWGARLPMDRAADADRLRSAIPSEGLVRVADADVALASAARHAAEQGGRLLVVGSVYLVGACFRALGLGPGQLGVFAGSSEDVV